MYNFHLVHRFLLLSGILVEYLDVCDITIASWFHETNNGMDGQNERKQ
jgi:hypothetical protein